MAIDPISYNLIKKLEKKEATDISNIENNISTIQDDVSNIKNDISDIENNIATIQDDISTIQNNISDIQNDISNIQDNVSKNKLYSEIKDISSNDSYTIDTLVFDIDFTKAIYDIKYLDPDSDSDTYDTYINSETVAIISIAKDGSSVTIKNYSDQDLTFLINIYTLQ